MYAYLKQNWLLKNPAATADEIETACRAIAKRLGL